MIAGTSSGSGKTTITCALLQALSARGYKVSAFKCGPDYIDPMFHSRVIGVSSRNLDGYFFDGNTMRYLFCRHADEISVMEGVMGFYDGVGDIGASMQAAEDTRTPVILVIDCKGMGLSMGAVMKGFLEYKIPNRICGFIFNRLAESQKELAEQLCREMHTEYFGRFPEERACSIASRHLGLVTAGELADIKDKIRRLGELGEQNLCMDKIISQSGSVKPLAYQMPAAISKAFDRGINGRQTHKPPLTIGVAMDEAFCFYYEDNLDLLRELGCSLVPFSPLYDKALPEKLAGLLLGGGYPELYADRLSANISMRTEIKKAVTSGLPTIAECGGFLYLQEQLEDAEGNMHPMAGVLSGVAKRRQRLQRFGYVDLTAKEDNLLCRAGQTVAAHEFHYWDSSHPGDSFLARKRNRDMVYDCVVANGRIYAGFPHLHFYAAPEMAVRFIGQCRARQCENKE